MAQKRNLNPAITEEQKIEEKERKKRYMREYRRLHPDYNRNSWIQSAIRILKKAGYSVIAPESTEQGA